MTRQQTPAYTAGFYSGIIAALAVVALHDQETLFDEIVNTVDAAKLVKQAINKGDYVWSGLKKYGYSKDGVKRGTVQKKASGH